MSAATVNTELVFDDLEEQSKIVFFVVVFDTVVVVGYIGSHLLPALLLEDVSSGFHKPGVTC